MEGLLAIIIGVLVLGLIFRPSPTIHVVYAPSEEDRGLHAGNGCLPLIAVPLIVLLVVFLLNQ